MTAALCPYCSHPSHGTQQCSFPTGVASVCRCNGKPGFWRRFFDALGNAIGQAKFGGD